MDMSDSSNKIVEQPVCTPYRELVFTLKNGTVDTYPLSFVISRVISGDSNFLATNSIELNLGNIRISASSVVMRLSEFFKPLQLPFSSQFQIENDRNRSGEKTVKDSPLARTGSTRSTTAAIVANNDAINVSSSPKSLSVEASPSSSSSSSLASHGALESESEALDAQLPGTLGTPSSVTSFKLGMKNTCIELITDPTLAQTHSICITWTLSTNVILSQNLNGDGLFNLLGGIDLSDVKIFNYVADASNNDTFKKMRIEKDHNDCILYPLSAQVSLFQCQSLSSMKADKRLSPVQALPRRSLKAHVDSISICVNYSSYRLLIAALNSLSVLTQRAPPPPAGASAIERAVGRNTKTAQEEASQKPITAIDAPSFNKAVPIVTSTLEDGDKESRTLAVEESEEEEFANDDLKHDDSFITTTAASIVTVRGSDGERLFRSKAPSDDIALFGDEDINASIGSISILILNDCVSTDIPVLRALFPSFNVDVIGYCHNRSLKCSIDMNIDYYNVELAAWEPLSEPCKMHALLQFNHLLKLNNDASSTASPSQLPRTERINASMSLHFSKEINLNATYAFYRSLSNSISMINKLENSATIAEMNHFYPYRLENSTEFPVAFQRVYNKDSIGVIGVVNGFSVSGFEFPSHTNDVNSALVLEFGEGPFDRIRMDVSLSHTHTQHRRHQGVGGQDVHLVVEVFLYEGVKIIRLRSRLGIANKTNTPIQLQSKDRSISPQPILLQPNGVYWAPLLCASRMMEIMVRPMSKDGSDETLEFSTPLKLEHPPQFDQQSIASASPSTSSRFYAVMYPHAIRNISALDRDLDLYQVPGGDALPGLPIDIIQTVAGDTPITLSEQDKLRQREADQTHGTIYAIRPRVLIENLLPSPADIRILESNKEDKTEQSYAEASLKMRESGEINTISLMSKYTGVSIRIPSLSSSKWSDIVYINMNKATSKSQDVSGDDWDSYQCVCMNENLQGEFYVNIDVSILHGCIRIAVWIPYWIFDDTDLGVRLSTDKKTISPFITSPTLTSSTKSTANENPPIMYNYPNSVKSKQKVYLTTKSCTLLSEIQWSDASISLDSFGGQKNITIPVVSSNNRNGVAEVSMSITQAAGRFKRTKIITITPQYVIVNRLNVDISVQQCYANSEALLIPSSSQQAFYWQFKDMNKYLSFRRASPEYAEWQWSGLIDPSQIGNMPMRLTHTTSASKSWYVKIETRLLNNTIFVMISEYDNRVSTLRSLLPYQITNRCVHNTIRFRQWIDKDSVTLKSMERENQTSEVNSKWVTLPPYSSMPYAWEHIVDKGTLELRIGTSSDDKNILRYRIDKQEDNESTLSVLDTVDQESALNVSSHKVHVYTESDGPTQQVIISDFPSPEKSLASSKHEKMSRIQTIAHIRQERIRELTLVKSDSGARISSLRARRSLYVSQLKAYADQRLVRPYTLPDERSYLIIKVLESKNLETKAPTHVIVSFNAVSVNSHPCLNKENFENPVYEYESLFAVPPNIPLSTPITFNVCEKNKELGRFELPLIELEEFESVRRWFPLHVYDSDNETKQVTGAEIHVLLWWIPATDTYIHKELMSLRQTIRERKRVYRAVCDELEALQEANIAATQHEYLYIQFMIAVRSITGLESLMKTLPKGRVIAIVTSKTTKKQCAIQLYNNDKNLNNVDEIVTEDQMPNEQAVCILVPEDEYDAKGESISIYLYLYPCASVTSDSYHIPSPICISHVHVPLTNIVADEVNQQIPVSESWLNKPFPMHMELTTTTDPLTINIQVLRSHPQISDLLSPNTRVSLSLPRIGVSLIDEEPQEMLYISLSGVTSALSDTNSQQSVSLTLSNFQIDNQLNNSFFPVVIGPTPVQPQEKRALLQAMLIKMKDPRPVQLFEYASILLQTLDIQIEEELCYRLLRLINEIVTNDVLMGKDDDPRAILRHDNMMLQPPPHSTSDLYFRLLHIQPLHFNVSFEGKPALRHSFSYLTFNPLQLGLDVIGTTLTSIDSAPIRLSGFLIENVYGSPTSISGVLERFYISAFFGQLYKIVGSLEFLGNPVNLVSSLGSGVVDFFYEPAQGAMTSPEEFAGGISRGATSLIKNTVSGVLNSAAGITSTLGKGVAMLSMDDEFIGKTARRTRAEPTNLASGVSSGATSLGSSVVSGVTGIVSDPIKGARQQGATGFLKGLGRGIVGAVAKPIAGAIDFTTQTLKGAGNTPGYVTSGGEINQTLPVRPPRPFDESRVLKLYDYQAALREQVQHETKLAIDDPQIAQQHQLP